MITEDEESTRVEYDPTIIKILEDSIKRTENDSVEFFLGDLLGTWINPNICVVRSVVSVFGNSIKNVDGTSKIKAGAKALNFLSADLELIGFVLVIKDSAVLDPIDAADRVYETFYRYNMLETTLYLSFDQIPISKCAPFIGAYTQKGSRAFEIRQSVERPFETKGTISLVLDAALPFEYLSPIEAKGKGTSDILSEYCKRLQTFGQKMKHENLYFCLLGVHGESLTILNSETTGSRTPLDLWKLACPKMDSKNLVVDSLKNRLTFGIRYKVGTSVPTSSFEDSGVEDDDVLPSFYPPAISYDRKQLNRVRPQIRIRGACVCDHNLAEEKISELLRQIFVRQISCLVDSIPRIRENSGIEFPFNLISTIVYIPESKFFLSIPYPESLDDEKLSKYRKSVLEELNFPKDVPLLRKSNIYRAFDRSYYQPLNIHLNVKYNPAPGNRTSLVKGNYLYHHYMQDSFDDSGWGCAYRSFQTIWSWFLLQGYTDKPVPPHDQIQKALVDIGDQQQNFIGSRKWIGSLELSFCLGHMLGIHSRILRADSGSRVSSLAADIAFHFDTEGIPIMIGGGVLAHTILGVDYNPETDDCRYLILDPHYTGGDENLNTIVSKGWCGWKPQSFWKPESFYNLLLPIRPKMF